MLDAMVVMPNHRHAVIHLGTDPVVARTPDLSDVMRWFMIRTTHDYTLGVRAEGWPTFPGKLWQGGVYDHIFRSGSELDKVRAYIDSNSGEWSDDEYNQPEPV